jgi:hypothetical protein
MSNGPIKISQLPSATNFSNSDLLVLVGNTGSTPTTYSVTAGVILSGVTGFTANNTNYVGTVSAANVVSNTQLQQNLTQYASLTGATFTNNISVANSIFVGNAVANTIIGYNSTDSSLAEFALNANNFAEVAVWNANTGNNASADFIVNDTNGTSPTNQNYIDIGINGSAFNQATWTINGPSDGYLYTGNTNLSIGTANANYINFFSNGTLSTNERMRIDAGGNVNIGNATAGATSLTVGNVTVKTVINSTSVTANSSLGVATIGTANGFLANTTTITIGNSSVNVFVNTSHFYSGNSTVYGVGNNTTEALVQVNFYGAGQYTQSYFTAANVYVGNTQYYGFGNSTVEGVYNTVVNTSAVMTASNLVIGNSTSNTVINSTAMILGGNTNAANGYTTLPNGFKLQWGWVSSNSSVGAVTFPAAFTTNAYAVTATSNTAVATYGAAVTAWTKTGATILTANVTSTNVFWHAVGL